MKEARKKWVLSYKVCLRPKLTQQFSKCFALGRSHPSALSPKRVQLPPAQLHIANAMLRVIDHNIGKDDAQHLCLRSIRAGLSR
jgi:hypothetical protein